VARPRRDPRGSPRLIGPQYGADARAKDRNVDPPRDSGPALTGGLFFRRCRSRTGSWVALTLRCPAVRGQHHVANPARGECGTRVSQCLTARNPYRVSPGSHWDRARDRVASGCPCHPAPFQESAARGWRSRPARIEALEEVRSRAARMQALEALEVGRGIHVRRRSRHRGSSHREDCGKCADDGMAVLSCRINTSRSREFRS